jgi:hypothetical protein
MSIPRELLFQQPARKDALLCPTYPTGPIPNVGVVAGLAVAKTLRTSSGLDGDLRGTNEHTSSGILRQRRDARAGLRMDSAECLLPREVDCDGHENRHGHAVQERRRVHPLPHGVKRGLIEQRD